MLARHAFLAFALVGCAMPAGAEPATTAVGRRVDALIARADAIKAKDRPAAYQLGVEAVALAEANQDRDLGAYFRAMDKITTYHDDSDLNLTWTLFTKFVAVATRYKGPDAYETLSATAGVNIMALFLGKPGATLDAIAVPLARAAPLAPTEKDRADMAGLATLLGGFYDDAGQHAKAVATVAIAARLYATPPATPNTSYYNGLTTLAKVYSGWREWDASLAAADRVIAAKIASGDVDEINAGPAYVFRGTALLNLGRYREAEAAYRDALAYADARKADSFRASVLNTLGNFYAAIGRDDLAIPLIERAAELGKGFPPGSASRAAALLDLYNIAMRRSDYRGALGFAQAIDADIATRTFKNSAQHAGGLIAIANAAMPTGDLVGAKAALDRAETMLKTAGKPGDARDAELTLARGRLAVRNGDTAGGAKLLAAARSRYAALRNVDPVTLASTDASLATALASMGDRTQAWTVARRGADGLAALALARSIASNATARLSAQDTTVLDTALDAAWGNRGR